jgi:hypothetical protein
MSISSWLALSIGFSAMKVPLALSGQPTAAPRSPAPDSVVLQRSSCYGTCPAYRLSIRADGFVHFVSLNAYTAASKESREGGATLMPQLVQELERAGFDKLPAMIKGRAPYCRTAMTDVPTITVSVYRGGAARTLSYYTGCIGDLPPDTQGTVLVQRMRALADRIDVLAAGEGWIRPAEQGPTVLEDAWTEAAGLNTCTAA